jgi:hypothetical protein
MSQKRSYVLPDPYNLKARPVSRTGSPRNRGQQFQAVAVSEAIVQADHLAADVDQELAPQPLVLFGARPWFEFMAALRKKTQHIA